MVNVHETAAYITKKRTPITAMKLQKLIYSCQAWSLVWDEEPLFPEDIEAWANGPVVRELYERHRGMFKVSQWNGDPKALSSKQIETVDAVLGYYGKMSSQQLSSLTHQEDPWKNARKGLDPGVRGSSGIPHAAMMDDYSALLK